MLVKTADSLVLALDGSTRVCSAALIKPKAPAPDCGWEVTARRAELDGRGQARVLLCFIDEMLAESGGGPMDLGAIVVGTGPGTFTGVRIAVATARALGLALSIPVVGVSTLGALAASAAVHAAGGGSGPAGLIVPVVDARRGQVFYGLYENAGTAGDDGATWARSADFGVCDREALTKVVAGQGAEGILLVAEDGALVGGLPPGAEFAAMQVQAERLVVGQDYLVEPGVMPQGSRLGRWLSEHLARPGWSPTGSGGDLLTLGSIEAGSVGTPESVKPIYVRAPDADIHITKMKDPWADGVGQR